jgi:hypothetical protein
MIKPRFAQIFWLLPALLICSSIATAEPASPVDSDIEPRFAAELQDATKLAIYKQRFVVTADVACRGSARRPSHCTAYIGSPISDAVQPEMILKYSSFMIDGQELEVEFTEDHNIKFWADVGVNYNGLQQFEVDLIYIK